jgi:Type IV secretion-system coupling protein DNA-binding domain
VTATARRRRGLVWLGLHWRRPVEADSVTALLRLWAADPRGERIALELRADSIGVRYLFGVNPVAVGSLGSLLTQTIPGARLTTDNCGRQPLTKAGSMRLTTRLRPLRSSEPEATVHAILGALSRVRADEELAVQLLLGARRSARSVPSSPRTPSEHPLLDLVAPDRQTDSEARAARRAKRSEPAFDCSLRVGVIAADRPRRRALVAGVLAAMRSVEAPGVRLRMVGHSAAALNKARSPLRWPMTINVVEMTGMLGWPLGERDLPGVPALHPVLLPPTQDGAATDRVIGNATAPGYDQPVGLSAPASLGHLWLLGPTGVGKSTLLLNLVCQDIATGRGVVVIEPKGDLVDAVLDRVPSSRLHDVVVLDPSDREPVGLNPLAGPGSAEVRVEGLLAVFRSLYADSWGPRTQDILSACLLTLARRGDASLVMVPLLLTNPGFRRSVTQHAVRSDPLALGAFWGWYEAMSDAERSAVIAPVMNKVRAFLFNPRLRGVLGQRAPRFDVTQVLSENKILLVPLPRGRLGSGTSQLLGSLVVAQLWQAIQARAATPPLRRHPVMVAIDEVQDYLHLPTDLGDALAQARGLGVGFTLAHQFVRQLPTDLQAGMLGNVRSRVCFQLGARDAKVMADGHTELKPDDLTALGAFDVYASLFGAQRSSPYVSVRTSPEPPAISRASDVRAASRRAYGQTLDAVERDLAHLIRPDGSPGLDSQTTGRRRRPE